MTYDPTRLTRPELTVVLKAIAGVLDERLAEFSDAELGTLRSAQTRLGNQLVAVDFREGR